MTNAAITNTTPNSPTDIEARLRNLASVVRPHPLLGQALLALEPRLPPNSQRRENIDRLLAGQAVAVITGQQCGFLLGPLFTLYKLATAIATAQHLERDLKIAAVPVFWVQSEDHDFDEIRSAVIPSADTPPLSLTISVTNNTPNTLSVKDRLISAETSTAISKLAAQLPAFADAEKFIALCTLSYQPGRSVCDAFRELISSVSTEFGVVIFDPRDDTAKELHQAVASQVFLKAVENHQQISNLLLERKNELESQGAVEQVKIRPDSPLCFFHPEGPHSPRFRLKFADNHYLVPELDLKFSAEELRERLHKDSRCFSSSALLRPIFQDSIFPTAIYVGGPAEVNYFAQIKPLYNHFAVEMPVILPRASFLLVDERTKRLLTQLELQATDVQCDTPLLLQKIASKTTQTNPASPNVEKLFSTALTVVAEAVRPLQVTLRKVDKSLDSAFQRNLSKFTELLTTLKPKLEEAMVKNDSIKAERVAKLQAFLYPEGVPQERFYCGAYFLARYGPTLLTRLVNSISNPLNIRQTTAEFVL